ncbi:MAG: hypothetical protein KDB23_34585, partial [Planctomycetales bacterium]|nr:hypothetical protein [Planctomycetales bacterium]
YERVWFDWLGSPRDTLSLLIYRYWQAPGRRAIKLLAFSGRDRSSSSRNLGVRFHRVAFFEPNEARTVGHRRSMDYAICARA